MLLGSPPDMVHGALSHRTRMPACLGTHSLRSWSESIVPKFCC